MKTSQNMWEPCVDAFYIDLCKFICYIADLKSEDRKMQPMIKDSFYYFNQYGIARSEVTMQVIIVDETNEIPENLEPPKDSQTEEVYP